MSAILVILSSSPYGDNNAQEGLEFAMAATNYGHQVSVLFEADGVWQLQPGQSPAKGVKHIGKRINSLPLFDVEPCFVCQQSLTARNIEAQFDDSFTLVSEDKKIAILQQSDHVVRF